ncbi:diguanylate cyclase [Limnochorda pilosa]|uniref:diguanylate cyclase n=1 Tax=Limnochorda pilosa TaxID=1555112 RepID=UPI0026EEDC8A|nr:diguanylate cyclase [Limnochorda pilosa]
MPSSAFPSMVLAHRRAVQIHWVGMGIVLAALILLHRLTDVPLGRVLGLLVLAAGVNGASALVVFLAGDRVQEHPQRLVPIVAAQLAIDLVILGCAVFASGGASSPFLLLFALHPALAGVVLPGRLVAILVGLGLVSLAAALGGSPLPPAGAAGWILLRGRPYPLVVLALAGGFMVVAGAVAAGLRRELREAERGWEQRALELEVLHQVVEADTAATDADAWIRRVTEILASTLYPDDVGFLFVDEATGTLRPHPSYHGLGPDVERISVPIGAGITGTVARDGQPLLVPDVRRDPRYIPIAPQVRAELCVPVRVGGRVVGVLNVESRRPGVLTQEDVHLMATIADHVGAVLAREEILRSERQARQKAESLEQVAAVLNSTLEWEALLDRVLEELARLVPSDGTSVQLLEGDRCRIVAIRGFDGVDGLLNMTFPLGGENPNRQVIRERRPVLLPDAPAAYPIFRRPPHHRTRSWLGVPLLSRGRVIGMIALDRFQLNAFTRAEAETAMAFANHVAIALENAGRYEATLRQALTDELTGLYNRRYLRQEMEREVLRSRRYRHPMSLLMIDLDDFKRYNDRYGHPAGDRLLRELAEVMQAEVRPTDSLVRYGGEEFAVILPETDVDGAVEVAQRLRRRVERHRFPVGEAGAGRVTISVGVAAFPHHGETAQEVLQAADRALFHAKREKNRVCRYDELPPTAPRETAPGTPGPGP